MKRNHLILIGLIAVAIIAIISALGDSSSYECFAIAAKSPDEEFHVVGKLVEKEKMMYDPVKDANLFSFVLQDNSGEHHKVIYHGAKPQDFERSEQVVIIGHMKDEVFEASKILTKCPSKYVENEVKVAGNDR